MSVASRFRVFMFEGIVDAELKISSFPPLRLCMLPTFLVLLSF